MEILLVMTLPLPSTVSVVRANPVSATNKQAIKSDTFVFICIIFIVLFFIRRGYWCLGCRFCKLFLKKEGAQTIKKPRSEIITDAVFLLPNEAISRFLLCKDLLTLDLKYYEKNSMQI